MGYKITSTQNFYGKQARLTITRDEIILSTLNLLLHIFRQEGNFSTQNSEAFLFSLHGC